MERLPSGVRVAALSHLSPASPVDYVVWADGIEVGPVTFHTAPRSHARGTVRVLAFGDSGFGSEPQLRLARLMEVREWDLAVHMGDIAYDHGSATEFTRRHFAVYRRLLARIALFPTPGNHDLRTDEGRHYDEAFYWPAPVPGARYYTFRWGDVRFVALDTGSETADVRGLREGRGRQYEWLVATLAEAWRDSTVAWTVVFGHHPVYSHAVGLSGHGPDRDLQRALAPLFDAYGVDLVLAGHDHHYERSRPTRAGRPVPGGCGPVYLVTGGGGASRLARDVAPSALTARISREHHFVALSITPRAIAGVAIGTDGSRLDEFRISPYVGGDGGPGCGS